MINDNVKKTNNIISFFIFLIIWISFFLLNSLDIYFVLSDYSWSLIFIVILSCIFFLRYVNEVNIVSLYSLFFMTSILFLGGRFISVFLGYEDRSIFEMDFFVNRVLSDFEFSKLFYLTILGFISLELGMYFSNLFFKKEYLKDNVLEKKLNSNSLLLYFIIFIIFIFLSNSILESFKKVLSGGYLELFSSQTNDYSMSFGSVVKTLFISMTGVYLNQKNARVRIIFLILMGVYFTFDIILGGRGGFVCYIIMLIWYNYEFGEKRVNVLKFFLSLFCLIVFLSSFLSIISLRVESVDNSSIWHNILALLYEQGVTLMVFNESLYIEKYPIVPFFQNFIPGFSFLYSTFIDNIPAYEKSLSSYISYSLNPVLFNNGYGLGWSFFADAYQYGMRNSFFYSIFIFIFSIFINYLQNNVQKNLVIKVLTTSLVFTILFLPRAGLNTVIPLIAYILVSFFIVNFISNILRR